MNMHMTGSDGVLSVPSEHLPGLIALVALPCAVWLAVCAIGWLAQRGVPAAQAVDGRLRSLSPFGRIALFGLLAGAAAHLAIVPTHWADERTTALLFVVDSVGFLAAAALLLADHRSWRLASLAMLGGTAGAYGFYILSGWESADLVGILTTTVELAAALVLLVPAPATLSAWRQRWTAALAVPVALATLVGAAAIAAGPTADTASADAPSGHSTSGDPQSMPGMSGSSTAHSLALATNSPAGPITWPATMPSDMQGMSMVTPDCSSQPTAAQQKAAVSLVNATTAAASKYQSLDAAKAAGYVPVTPTGRKVVHYINYSIARSIATQGSPLDPNAIPVLVYVNTSHGAVLSAAMYLALGRASAAGNPPQPGGCLMEWHTHSDLCFSGARVVGNDTKGACSSGSTNQTTRPMMHVWMAPVSGGPLAPDPGPVAEVQAAAQLPALAVPNGVA
jgi:hypothetical protein